MKVRNSVCGFDFSHSFHSITSSHQYLILYIPTGWIKAYKGCLELVIPYELKKVYHIDNGGCINPDLDDGRAGKNFKVEVIFHLKDTQEETLKDTCKYGGPEECDGDCQKY